VCQNINNRFDDRLDSAILATSAGARQKLLEGATKVSVEYRVNDRIERRVAVAQPEYHGENWLRYFQSGQQWKRVDEEERQPASDERNHNDAKNESGSSFSGSCRLALCSLQFRLRRVVHAISTGKSSFHFSVFFYCHIQRQNCNKSDQLTNEYPTTAIQA